MARSKLTSLALLAILAILAGSIVACSIGAGNVIINEVELSPPANAARWVELYNSGTEAVDISGWTAVIKDGAWEGPSAVPIGTIIEPDGYYVMEGDPRWLEDRFNATVTLRDASGIVVDETPLLSDSRSNDFSLSRIPNGKDTNTAGDWAYFMASKGKANGGSIVRS